MLLYKYMWLNCEYQRFFPHHLLYLHCISLVSKVPVTLYLHFLDGLEPTRKVQVVTGEV